MVLGKCSRVCECVEGASKKSSEERSRGRFDPYRTGHFKCKRIRRNKRNPLFRECVKCYKEKDSCSDYFFFDLLKKEKQEPCPCSESSGKGKGKGKGKGRKSHESSCKEKTEEKTEEKIGPEEEDVIPDKPYFECERISEKTRREEKLCKRGRFCLKVRAKDALTDARNSVRIAASWRHVPLTLTETISCTFPPLRLRWHWVILFRVFLWG